MKLFFLSADVPFAKTITPEEVIPYPHIARVTSHEVEIDSLRKFHDEIKRHGELGHCLLKGQLHAPLIDQSRAGTTDNNDPTEWIVFDIDGLNVSSAEEFISALPEPFHSCSYIEQISSTAYLNGNGYKAHLFFVLSEPTTPAKIKNFILNVNFNFDEQITLGTGNLCLNYPLDIQVNNNSTPLYIATPNFINVEDPVKTRLSLIVKATGKVSVPDLNPGEIKARQKKKLTQLRHDLGLRGKQPTTSMNGSVELLDNIEPMNTPATRTERGFVYLALNKGNPYSYYHPVDNPAIIYNFRGEPAFLTKKGLPDYWEAVKPRALSTVQPNGKIPVIFRDRAQDLYINGFKTEKGWELSATKNKSRLNDFARQFGLDEVDAVEDWDMVFDPTDLTPFSFENKRVNLYYLPDPLRHCMKANPTDVSEIPPWTKTLIESITGNDEKCFDHFINWLACIFQTRKKTRTAWVFQGVEGTGKGLFFNHIIAPLFGHHYCCEKMIRNLVDTFNGWLEQCLFLLIDESRIERSVKNEQIPDMLKSWITEPKISIRKMRANQYEPPNFTNFIFATNNADALEIGATDRRYNVCPEQQNAVQVPIDIEERLKKEIIPFAEFLWSYPINEELSHIALNNLAKTTMHESKLSDFAFFVRRIIKGNFEFFFDIYTQDKGALPEHGIYKGILREWKDRLTRDGQCVITKNELKFIYNYFHNKTISEVVFGRLAVQHKLNFTFSTVENKRQRVFVTTWTTGVEFFNDL